MKKVKKINDKGGFKMYGLKIGPIRAMQINFPGENDAQFDRSG